MQVGICKVHVKFALKKSNSAPKSVAPPVEEPLKRKASVKKKPDSSKSAKIEAKKESPEKVKRDALSNGTDDNVLLDAGRM